MDTIMGKVINKYKSEGVLGVANAASNKILYSVNRFLFYTYQKMYPIQDNLIVLESEGDLSDNAYALFDYMVHNDYLKKYHVIWLVDDVEKARLKNFPNTEFCQKVPKKINFQWAKALATCKWYIYDHCNLMSPFYKRNDQQLIYLSHGVGFKASKGIFEKPKSDCDKMTVTGPLAATIMTQYWKEPIEKAIITGYPRLDYFFKQNNLIAEKINKRWQFTSYKKVFFWMPTFRQSNNIELSEDYIKNETGLPFFQNRNKLQEMSHFLQSNNLLLVLKLHHLQANLPIFKEKFMNILIVHDEDLQSMNIQLYQFLLFADALITDYSSVYTDYLLLDRPVIFTLDDYDEYDKSRGLFPKNAIDYMKGYHIYNEKELKDSLLEIAEDIDKYKDDRKKVIDQYHTYKDGGSANRVLKMLGINK